MHTELLSLKYFSISTASVYYNRNAPFISSWGHDFQSSSSVQNSVKQAKNLRPILKSGNQKVTQSGLFCILQATHFHLDLAFFFVEGIYQ